MGTSKEADFKVKMCKNEIEGILLRIEGPCGAVYSRGIFQIFCLIFFAKYLAFKVGI